MDLDVRWFAWHLQPYLYGYPRGEVFPAARRAYAFPRVLITTAEKSNLVMLGLEDFHSVVRQRRDAAVPGPDLRSGTRAPGSFPVRSSELSFSFGKTFTGCFFKVPDSSTS